MGRIQDMHAGLISAVGSAVSRARAHENSFELLRGTAGSLIVKVTASGLLFVSQVVFARILGVEGFGIYILVLAWIAVLLLVGRLGFDLATVRFVAAYHGKKEWGLLGGFLTAAPVLVLGGACVISLGVAGYVWLAGDGIGTALAYGLLLTTAILPVLALVQVMAAALRGLGHVVLGDVPHAVAHPLILVIGLPVAVSVFDAPASPTTALSVYLAASLGSLALLIPMLNRYLPGAVRTREKQYRWRQWLKTALPMAFIAGFSVLLNQSTTIMVGALAGVENAGLYGAASRLAAIIQIVTFSLVTALGPMAARLHEQKNQAELQRIVDASAWVVSAVALAAGVILVFWGEFALSLFGAEFVSAQVALPILVGGQLVWAATAPAGILLNMTGHQNVSAIILAVSAALNIGLCALLIPEFGFVGAAWATAIAMAVWNISMVVWTRRRIGIFACIRPVGQPRVFGGGR